MRPLSFPESPPKGVGWIFVPGWIPWYLFFYVLLT